MNKYEKIIELIQESNNITILSGAGVSVPSGIPDFRSRGGLYEDRDDVETILSRSFFHNDIELFWERYKEIFYEKIINQNYKPNAAHELPHVLASLGKNVSVITQNVDGLYQLAGNQADIFEMHGNIKHLTCIECNRKHPIEDKIHQNVPKCNTKTYGNDVCKGNLNVDVVLFGDRVNHYNLSKDIVQESDLIIVMGTSLQVQPFSNLLTNNKKRKNILLNKTNISNRPFEVKLIMDVAESSQKIIDMLNIQNKEQ